ncbi:hypothetical protein VTN00DRAFT_8573 [Thermoascus crustaceus]
MLLPQHHPMLMIFTLEDEVWRNNSAISHNTFNGY